MGIRATARVFEVEANTVLNWLVEAAEQLRAFSAHFLCDLHVEQLQLDELYAVLRDLKAGAISEDEAMERLERSPYWVWTAMDPQSKLLLVIDVGTRTLAMAQRVVHQVVQRLAPGCVPLFLTDGFRVYDGVTGSLWPLDAAGAARDKGPLPKPRWVPVPELLYAQVVKSYRRRRIVGVNYRVILGRWSGCSRCLRRAAARSIRHLWRDSTWTSASAWPRWAVGSTPCVRARTASASS